MYTVVLMAALTTSVDLPDRGGRRGGGCCGCHGGGYGGGYGGCMGMGYGGGWGGGYGGCMGMGMGYGGGCMGMGYGGCTGMGYGGGCMGMGYGGCTGMGYGGGYGGCVGMGVGGFGYAGGTIMQGATIQSGTGTGGERINNPPRQQKKNDESMAPAPATIVVELPADAKLLIDNEATASSGSSRVFQSPTLNPGREYHYTLLAEVVRDGKTVKAEQVVTIKSGEITPVKLTLPAAGVAQR